MAIVLLFAGQSLNGGYVETSYARQWPMYPHPSLEQSTNVLSSFVFSDTRSHALYAANRATPCDNVPDNRQASFGQGV